MRHVSSDRGYRADIDGLRAVAVLAVALFHGHLGLFPGGFVGVDVFFVISGYLITGIISAEIRAERFSIWRFYERRLRRIGPALAVVVLAVAVFTLLYKTPREANMFGEGVTFVVLMISNFFFFGETGYFGEAANRFALLHTWSLSVEEQFYLFWPPLMVLLFGRLARWRVSLLLTLFALSLIGAEIALELEPMAAFYLAPFRIWELMLGAALALGYVPKIRRSAVAEAAAGLGLAMILFSAVFFEEGMRFPGASALVPTLGTALIIHAGEAGRRTMTSALLSTRPMVFVGLCSYSFYLWHWPALSFASYMTIRPLDMTEALAALAVAFALSVASLYWVERPFRRKSSAAASASEVRGLSTRAVAASMGAAAVAFLGLGILLQETKGLRDRFPDMEALFTEKTNRYGLRIGECADVSGLVPASSQGAIRQTFCRFGDKATEADFLVWGDSHALAFWPAFADAAAETGRSGYLSVLAQCPPLVSTDLVVGYAPDDCRDQNRAVIDIVRELGLKQVVLVASWLGYGGGGEATGTWLAPRLAQTVRALEELGVQVAVTAPAPGYAVNVPSAVFRSRVFDTALPEMVSQQAYFERAGPVLAEFAKWSIRVLPVHDVLCGSGVCAIEMDGIPIYSDTNHLNEYGAKLLKPMAIELLSGASADNQ